VGTDRGRDYGDTCVKLLLVAAALGRARRFQRRKLAFLRPLMLPLTLGLIGLAIFFRHRSSACCDDTSRSRAFWPLLLVAASFALFPVLLPGTAPVANSATGRLLQIDGITCESCATGLQAGLTANPNITWADVDYASGTPRIPADSAIPAKTKVLAAALWSVAARCEPCIAFCVGKARELGASEAEISDPCHRGRTGCVGEMWARKGLPERESDDCGCG
jgi:AhpD family alkylhydroperoxidase